MKKEWYLGLDLGTNSIGWAATDTDYKVLRKSKRKLIGVFGRYVYLQPSPNKM